jgi:hypothetical protein
MPEPGLVMPPSARRCTPARQEGLNAPSHGVRGDRKCGPFPRSPQRDRLPCPVRVALVCARRDSHGRGAAHDRLAREYAADGDVVVVSADYSLPPEAKFPRALVECAAVVRHLAEYCSG